MPVELIFTSRQLDEITAHIERWRPEEACGLVGGIGPTVKVILPVENELHSPVRFRMAPLAQLKGFDRIEALGWELLAIFHSHPQGPAGPSPTDIAEFFYPGSAVIIASPLGRDSDTGETADGLAWGEWRIKAFLIEPNRIHTVKLTLFT